MCDTETFRVQCQDLIWSDEDLERFHRLYALRSHLESFVVREATARVAQGHSLEGMECCWREMHEAGVKRDYQRFLDADVAFHQAAAELAQVPGLAEIWKIVAHRGRDFVAWAHRTVFRDLSTISENHQRLLSAIRRGDAQDAEREAQAGLDSLWQIISERPAIVGSDGDPMGRVCGYVIYNLSRPLSLTHVARDVAHLSAGHLAKLFRETLNESFRTHVQRLRLNRAAVLLRETDYPVQIIAARVGYSDCSRFASYFSRRFGCTPTQWREQKGDPGHTRGI